MRTLLTSAVLFVGVFFFAAPAQAYTSPGRPVGYVNDFAGVLSARAKVVLEHELANYHASTTDEMAIVIVKNMGGDYIESYAPALLKDWGIGSKKNNNGVLLLLSMDERKLRIEVGYGLEGVLPDSVAAQIINNDMAPRLKKGDYDGAVVAGAADIIAATQGAYTPPPPPKNPLPAWLVNNWEAILIFGFVLLQWAASVFARSKSWWAGGVVGGIGGFLVGAYIAPTTLLMLVIACIFGAFGLLLDYLVSNAYLAAGRTGSTPPFWAGGGGFGGSSSGGGFGGLGGGSSGGGGASGGW